MSTGGDDDVTVQFGADFTEAHQDINDFFEGIRRTTVGSVNGLEEVSDSLDEVADSAAEVTRISVGMAVALGAAATAAAALLGATALIGAAYVAASSGIGFFVDSVKLAMEAEDEAYEAAVKLAEEQGRLAPVNHTLSEMFKELSETVKDAKAQLGEAFLPVIKELVPIAIVLAERVRDLAQGWAEWAKETADTSGLSNLETSLIKIVAYFETLLESLDILAIKWRVFNEITTVFFWNEEQQNNALNELGNKLVKEGFDSTLVRETINAGGPSFSDRQRQNEEELQRDVTVKQNENAEGGVKDAVRQNEQLIKNAFEWGAKQIAEGIHGGSREGVKAFDQIKETLGGVFDEYAKGVAESEAAQWAEAGRIVDAFPDKDREKPFTSGIEDSVSTFRRIQTSVASRDDIPRQQLTVAQEQLKRLVEQHEAQQRIDGGIGELIGVVKKGVPAVAGP